MTVKLPVLFFDFKVDFRKEIASVAFVVVNSDVKINKNLSFIKENVNAYVLREVFSSIISLYYKNRNVDAFELHMFPETYSAFFPVAFSSFVFPYLHTGVRRKLEFLKKYKQVFIEKTKLFLPHDSSVSQMNMKQRTELFLNYTLGDILSLKEVREFVYNVTGVKK